MEANSRSKTPSKQSDFGRRFSPYMSGFSRQSFEWVHKRIQVVSTATPRFVLEMSTNTSKCGW